MKNSMVAKTLVGLCLFALGVVPKLSAQSYSLTDLGNLGNTTRPYAYPTAINKTGQVVGLSLTPSNFFHAFLWNNGNMQDLVPFAYNYYGNYAFAINDAGQVVGYFLSSDNSNWHPFIYSGGTTSDISSTLGVNHFPYGINASGQIVGWFYDRTTSADHAFSYDGTMVTDLNSLVPGALNSFAYGVNKTGQVVGLVTFYSGGTYVQHAFLWSGGVATDLGTLPGGNNSEALAINDSGQITGDSYDSSGNIAHLVVWSGGSISDLGADYAAKGISSYGRAINSVGQIVGGLSGPNSFDSGFVYNPTSGIVDLNTLIPSGTSYPILIANGINNAGQIAGFYGSLDGITRGYLLTPNNTQVGTYVSVQPVYAATGSSPVSLTFSDITSPGATSLTVSTTGPAPSQGFKLGTPATYYNLSTTATYSGSITICINYNGVSFHNPSQLSIWHFDITTSSWTQLATTVDTIAQTACATTPSLSPFALLEPWYAAQVQQPINPDGTSVFSVKKGVVPVKFTLTYGGLATCQLPQATISLSRTSGGTVGSIDESSYLLASDTGSYFRIDTTNCQYVYNLATSSLGTGTYRVNVSIGGSVAGSGIFGLQ